MTAPDTLPAALAIGQSIGPVFPTIDGKPRCAHGYKDASRHPDEIKRLWARCPGANVSVAMGAASGLLGLDVDVKGGRDGKASLAALEAEHGPLPPTPHYTTPSGGLGYLFCHPGGSVQNRMDFLPGLELHSDGTAMTLPPSRKDGRAYVWQLSPANARMTLGGARFADPPPWLLAAAAPARAPILAKRATLHLDSFDRMARYVGRAVDEECGAVAAMAHGSGRNRQLFVAAAKLGGLVGAGLLSRDLAEGELEAAAQACSLAAEDGWRAVRATIASGLNRGISSPREVTR